MNEREFSDNPFAPSDKPPAPGLQEPERIWMGRVVGITLASLAAFAAVSVWAVLILNSNVRSIHPGGPPPAPAELGRAEIGIVNHKMFEVDRRVDRRTAALKESLTSYGWVDREKGIVHVPIDRAMDAVFSEQPQ